MNTKILFYSFFALMFAGSLALAEMDSTEFTNVVTVSSSSDSDERSPAEKREEQYEATEAQAEADLPDAVIAG